MGDGVLVYFGYPQAHEDDAERAVRAGLEPIGAVSALKRYAPLQTRVGIARLLALSGKASDAVHMIIAGVTSYRSTGATMALPLMLSYLAGAYAELGRFHDARRCLGEAMQCATRRGAVIFRFSASARN
jgi:hypothetical protein